MCTSCVSSSRNKYKITTHPQKLPKIYMNLNNEIKCPSLDTKTQMDKFGHYWTIWTFGQTKMAQTKQMVKRDGQHKRNK